MMAVYHLEMTMHKPSELSSADQEKLIRALAMTLDDKRHPARIFETHISWIVVARDYAYKFKKPVRFDFLDFSTLDARHFYCQEELRLNRRLAPELYLNAVGITGNLLRPQIDGAGAVIDYAVKMHAFPQQALWSDRVDKAAISNQEIDQLALKIAQFHQAADIAPSDSAWGASEAIAEIAADNIAAIADLTKNSIEKNKVKDLHAWQDAQHKNLDGAFASRKAQGYVRECHGDLHCGNILTLDERVVVFDCIEFSERLRWIDVMNDLAFICMDLQSHGLHRLAARLLNAYLEHTGDYEGLAVLPYYRTQRALVRCKIALLRAAQMAPDLHATASHQAQAAKYLALALEGIRPTPSAILIMHGYSGCGKSTLSALLVELLGAIRIRSDVERKRMHGLAPTSRAGELPEASIYAGAATEKTYSRLRDLARHVVEAGMFVIVDAAFLKNTQRALFAELANELGVPFIIFDVRAKEALLRKRIVARAKQGLDPSDAGLQVLAHQLAENDPLSEAEMKQTIVVNSEGGMDEKIVRTIDHPLLMSFLKADLHTSVS